MSKYRATWQQEDLMEFTLVYVARWRGKDGKRYASPFKTKDSAEKKAKELKSKGNSEVSVTQDTLRGNIKFKSDNSPDIKGMQKEEAIVEFTSQQIKQAYDIANDPRYKQGNYDGAVKAIEKLAKGLSKHPDVANVLKRTNEDINERYSVKFSYSKGGKIANAYYDDKDEAEKFIKSVISKGGKAIMTMEDAGDYLRSKMNPTQIANIKKVWQGKKASDVTPAVKDMIKRLDIPTQLAIKQANVPHLSKLVEHSCECKCGESPCKSCGKDHHTVKEDASKMAQAMATGTQKKIADLSARIKDTEARRKDIDVGDKTQMAINKADVHHMQLKLADLKDKLRLDRAKRSLAAQNEPKLPNRLMAVEQIHPAKSLIENLLKKRSKK